MTRGQKHLAAIVLCIMGIVGTLMATKRESAPAGEAAKTGATAVVTEQAAP